MSNLTSPNTTSSHRRAGANFSANRSQLAVTQPTLAELLAEPLEVEYVFGRDSYLTALDSAGDWWFGCSIPQRAAAELLKHMSVTGVVTCMLPPPHAAFVRTALDRTLASQALIVLAPDLRELHFLLACDDFSEEIESKRLWFAWGERWERELAALFEREPGLPTPAQFTRAPLGDLESSRTLIASAEKTFASVNAQRAELGITLRKRYAASDRAASNRLRFCLINRREFALWDDAAFTLTCALSAGNHEAVVIDSDTPTSVSPLALLAAAVRCDAIVSADTGRATFPDLLPTELPWVTWITRPGLPPFAAAGPNDRLMLADPGWKSKALSAGWPADRVTIAAWPDLRSLWGRTTGSCEQPSMPADAPLAIIIDTVVLDPPARLDDFSSHRLLWETIREELLNDPFTINCGFGDPAAYLEKRRLAANIAADGFDSRLFTSDLILPAYAQGIARLLIRSGLRVRLHGAGWCDLQEFSNHAVGAISSRADLSRAVASAAALVHAWPSGHAHPIDACGKAVVRGTPAGMPAFVRASKNAAHVTAECRRDPLTGVLSRSLVHSLAAAVAGMPRT